MLPAANSNVAVEFGAQFNNIPQTPDINIPKTVAKKMLKSLIKFSPIFFSKMFQFIT